MYFIIQYKSDSDSGVVFVPYEATHDGAIECVSKSINIKYPNSEIEIIGFCKTLDVSKLSKVEDYAYFTDTFTRVKRDKLPYPVYYSRGVCRYVR